MAQFDVYRSRRKGTLVVNCQSDLLDALPVRYAIPLFPPNEGDWMFTRVAPLVSFQGKSYKLVAPLGAAVAVAEMGAPLGSLADQRYEILNAIDFLLTGV